MSHHIHSIAGNSRAMADYEEYLERLRAARLAEKEDAIRRKSRAKKWDSYFDAARQSHDNPRRNRDQRQQTDADDEAGQGGGFGKHYA